jgi:hypothetical protein
VAALVRAVARTTHTFLVEGRGGSGSPEGAAACGGGGGG